MVETCAVCGCRLHRGGEYGKPTLEGRAHATKHHYVAERFFGRSGNRPHTERQGVFSKCPWGMERKRAVFCYECHEELLHNPVFLPDDIRSLAQLVRLRRLSERKKPRSRKAIAGRIKLLHQVIEKGLQELLKA